MGRRRARLGRRRGAHERRGPRLGHGGLPRPLQLGRSLRRGRGHRRREPPVLRLPLLLGDGVAGGGGGGVGRHAGIGGGGAGGGDRHRPMAARASTGRLQRRLGVHQPRGRLGGKAHRGGRAEGLPDGHGARVGEARQLHSGGQGRSGGRRARAHGARARRGVGADRGRTAGRGPPPRLRRRENGPVDGSGRDGA